jgi:succinate dehydrogenase hydrophobic anchor subunit
MSPELINAIKERIARGHSKEAIKNEVLAMGHAEVLFEAAYTLAEHDAAHAPEVVRLSQHTPQRLSSVIALVKEAIVFTCDRLGMVGLIALPLVLFVLATELGIHFEGDLMMTALISGLTLVVFLLYMVNLMVTLYLVSRGSELEPATYAEGFSWAKKNFFGLFFVYLLTMLAVWGGFVLFIIPGFILLISLYFSQYVFVVEEKRGMAALLRSRALVKGRKLSVFIKILGLTLLFFIPVFVVAFTIEIVNSFYSLADLRVLGEVLMQIAAAFFTILSMRVMFQMYRELSVGVVDEAPTRRAAVTHWLLVAIGAVIIPLIIIAVIFFSSISEFGDMAEFSSEDSESVSGMSLLGLQADRYFEDNGSYLGVCEPLTSALGGGEGIECNESDTEWAISASSAEQQWCVDSTNPSPKRIVSALEGRTGCFNI